MERTALRLARRPPQLLLLVFGVAVALLGITAVAQHVLVSAHFTTATLNAIASADAHLASGFVNDTLSLSDLDGRVTDDRRRLLETRLARLLGDDDVLRLELRGLDGTVLYSDTAGVVGAVAGLTPDFQAAASGESRARVVEAGEDAESGGAGLEAEQMVRIYLPLATSDGQVHAVLGLWRDAGPIMAGLEATRRDILLVAMLAAGLLLAILYAVFRSAQRRLSRQTHELIEATRRDALTGMLNHGAVVGVLSERLDVARAAGQVVEVALLDLDNFGLLNEAHGHTAADEALVEVAGLLEDVAGSGVVLGRYGPDEFLLVGPCGDREGVEPAVRTLAARLTGVALQFGHSERLPVTVSAGICRFPEHGKGTTELLSVATVTLGRAKSGGGDQIASAAAGPEPRSALGGFDVLQGLVFAIDTKDRYTKRHSDDVARYALFLAEQLGLESSFQDTLRIAGLLHDVGKIGIPDQILRKPGRLTAEEEGIVQQHVALGDAIVRDLPDVEMIRDGIRHHHERWDGKGYLAGLAGAEIPAIARILAVADMFSAMTTTRPYRKALSVPEALRRLGDAAGTQVDERLVTAFITGIERVPDAPMPGVARGTARPFNELVLDGSADLWVPREAVRPAKNAPAA